jgi:ComF family protein
MSVIPQIRRIGGITLDLLFPKSCVGCGREGSFICESCLPALTRIPSLICPKCGRPQINGIICSDCIHWRSNIDGIRSPFRFEGTIRKAVHQFKYKNIRALAPALALLMYEYLVTHPISADVIVPVPLHPKRLRERGYNQSELLAKELGKLLSITVERETMVRKKYTPPQARTTSVIQRRRNMADAFACNGNRLRNYRILLIDDVSTSATTLDACAKALKEAGALSVWGLVLAREI